MLIGRISRYLYEKKRAKLIAGVSPGLSPEALERGAEGVFSPVYVS